MMRRILCLILVFCSCFLLFSGCENKDKSFGGKENMIVKTASLKNPERFNTEAEVSREKITDAMNMAVENLRKNLDKFYEGFPDAGSTNFEYTVCENFNWTSGLYTGCCWLAYEYTGDEVFKEAAMRDIEVYTEKVENEEWFNDHDTGFIFTPSCVAGYKITGDKKMRDAALKAASILLKHYDKENRFLIRSGFREDKNLEGYRMLVDSMMNIPLFFFAYEETGNKEYYDAAVEHYYSTIRYLIREDGSSYHHYQFDPKTGKPVEGITWQGVSNNSCWSRGHAWALYGFPIAYAYTHDDAIISWYKNISYYYLNCLPKDNIPYWDLVVVDGSDEPKDASASAISTCGFLEMCKWLPDDIPWKKYFQNAANAQMNTLIDKCENKGDADGLILNVSYGVPQNLGVEECGIFGDYFYMEALMRYLNSDWNMYW